MKLLLTITAQILKTSDNRYWVDSVYSYSYFQRYLSVFDNIKLITRVKSVENIDTRQFTELSGPNLEICALPHYHGPWEYAKKISEIRKIVRNSIQDCNCAVLRIPDEISFRIAECCYKNQIPFAVEVVSDSWDFFRPGTFKTILRPFLRLRWHIKQKNACRKANCVSYVTDKYIQKITLL